MCLYKLSFLDDRVQEGVRNVRQRWGRMHIDEGAGSGDEGARTESHGAGATGDHQRGRHRRYVTTMCDCFMNEVDIDGT